ncbi:MAG: hypothetical protein WC538_22740 [Thermoanaerobaculia bacterium]
MNEPNPTRSFRYPADQRERVANFFDAARVDSVKVYSTAELASELGVSIEIVSGAVDEVACPAGQLSREEAEFVAREVLPASLVEEALADESRAFSIPLLERPILVTIPLPRRIVREAQGRYASRPAYYESRSFEDWLGVQVDFELGTREQLDFSRLNPQEGALLSMLLDWCVAA